MTVGEGETETHKLTIKDDIFSTENPSQAKDCQCVGGSLHHFECLPTHLRFNHFVEKGYRMDLNTWECLKSLVYVHNESFNIYSHGLPCLVFILSAPYVYNKTSHSDLYPFLYSIHYIASILCSLLSTVYHFAMCHEKGEDFYHKLITLDMLGIWLASTFTNIAFIKATFYCLFWWDKLVLPLYSCIAVVGLVCSARGKNARERQRPLMFLGISRMLLYTSRYVLAFTGYPTAHVSTTWIFLAAECFGCLGGIVNLSRFPEKWFPGKFDYLGNSHNIMHVLVIGSPLACHFATVIDFEWMANATCHT